MATVTKRATNVSIRSDVIADARELGINLSEACEKGVVAEISVKRGERWLEENMDAIRAWNAWTEENGLPLAKYRLF